MPIIEQTKNSTDKKYVFAHKYVKIWSLILLWFWCGSNFLYISEVEFCPDLLIFCVQNVFLFNNFFISEKCCVPNDYENSGHFICFNCNFASKSSLVLLNYVLRQVLYPTNNVKNEERAFLRTVFDFYAQHWTQKISAIITPQKKLIMIIIKKVWMGQQFSFFVAESMEKWF